MTLEQFSESSPGTAEIRFFVGDQAKTVQGITISTSACNGLNTYESLLLIESLTVNIGGDDYTFRILNREVKLGYFFLTVEDEVVENLSTPVQNSNSPDCNFVNFTPSVYDPEFENSDYNALFANATDIRLNTFAYDVDRQKSQTSPTNLDNIISGSAIYAPVPDSNYTSIGMLNSKYNGTKTSIEEYGVEAAFNLVAFEGAVYGPDVEVGFICSQSFSDRKITEFGFIKSNALISNINSYPDTAGFRQDPTSADGFIFSPNSSIGVSQTLILATFENSVNITTGDILGINRAEYSLDPYTDYEFVEVEEIISATPAAGNRTQYSLRVKRGITGQSNAISPASPLTLLYIFKIKSDIIYEFETNTPSKLTNRYLYIPNTQKILYVGTTGKVVYVRETCTI